MFESMGAPFAETTVCHPPKVQLLQLLGLSETMSTEEAYQAYSAELVAYYQLQQAEQLFRPPVMVDMADLVVHTSLLGRATIVNSARSVVRLLSEVVCTLCPPEKAWTCHLVAGFCRSGWASGIVGSLYFPVPW